MDVMGFVAEFPEFAMTDPLVIAAKLAEAGRRIGVDAWGSLGTSSAPSTVADDAQKYLTAHLLTTSAYGQPTRLEPGGVGTSTYLAAYEALVASQGFGMLVAGSGWWGCP